MKKLLSFLRSRDTLFVSILSTFISITFSLVMYQTGKHLADYDSIARLNIARKIIDSITPGLGQLGGIWLPFPQALMTPLVVNNFFWHSGLAGTIVSSTAFIIGSIYLYKLIFLITGKRLASFIGWLVYVSNVNILYLQTTAMSESFFLCLIILILYFLTLWTKTHKIMHLLFAASFVTLITLTRYEGYIVFIAAWLSVLIVSISYFKIKNFKKSEGIIIIFTTLASFGIVLWTLYSALIYQDPIYWLNLYTGKKTLVSANPIRSTEAISVLDSVKGSRDFLSSLTVYPWSMSLMNGLFISILGILSILVVCVIFSNSIIKNKLKTYLIPLIITAFLLFSFLIFGYYRSLIPPIEQPPLSFETLLSKENNGISNSNIRYGIIVLPLIAIAIGYLSTNTIFSSLSFIILISQIYFLSFTPYFFWFNLVAKYNYKIEKHAEWFIDNYDDGKILVSANRHEPFMFQTGFQYSTYIYEGSQNYWKMSIQNPSQYAKWVIVSNRKGDYVNELMIDKSILKSRYQLEYSKNGVNIFKIKEEYEAKLNKITAN